MCIRDRGISLAPAPRFLAGTGNITSHPFHPPTKSTMTNPHHHRRRRFSSSELARLHVPIVLFTTIISFDTGCEIFGTFHPLCHAYSFPSIRPRFDFNSFGFGAGGFGGEPPSFNFLHHDGFDDNENRDDFSVGGALLMFHASDSSDEPHKYYQHNETIGTDNVFDPGAHIRLRGGGGIGARTGNLFSAVSKRLLLSKSKDTSQST